MAAPRCASPSAATCSHHDPNRRLDHGIIRAHWLRRDELAAQAARLRSPLVLRCVDDFLAGRRHDLDALQQVGAAPAIRIACSGLTRVIVAMSGGVDSAVAALLLRRAGPRCPGPVHAQLGRGRAGILHGGRGLPGRATRRRRTGHSPAPRRPFARIPRARVHAISSMPTAPGSRPIRMCCAIAKSSSATACATRSAWAASCWRPATTRAWSAGADGPELHKGVDADKDQSYFLHAVPRERFAQRAVAAGRAAQGPRCASWRASAGLPVFDKRDSTGICFIGERPFREFLAQYIEHQPGPIGDRRRAGRSAAHVGLAFYTLGQRAGIGIGGHAGIQRRTLVRGGQGRAPQCAHRGTGRGSPSRCSRDACAPGAVELAVRATESRADGSRGAPAIPAGGPGRAPRGDCRMDGVTRRCPRSRSGP